MKELKSCFPMNIRFQRISMPKGRHDDIPSGSVWRFWPWLLEGKRVQNILRLYRALLFFQIKSIFAGLLTTVSFPFRAIQHSFHFLPASLFWFFFFYLHHITAMFSCWVIAKISLLQDFREAGGGNSSVAKWLNTLFYSPTPTFWLKHFLFFFL